MQVTEKICIQCILIFSLNVIEAKIIVNGISNLVKIAVVEESKFFTDKATP